MLIKNRYGQFLERIIPLDKDGKSRDVPPIYECQKCKCILVHPTCTQCWHADPVRAQINYEQYVRDTEKAMRVRAKQWYEDAEIFKESIEPKKISYHIIKKFHLLPTRLIAYSARPQLKNIIMVFWLWFYLEYKDHKTHWDSHSWLDLNYRSAIIREWSTTIKHCYIKTRSNIFAWWHHTKAIIIKKYHKNKSNLIDWYEYSEIDFWSKLMRPHVKNYLELKEARAWEAARLKRVAEYKQRSL